GRGAVLGAGTERGRARLRALRDLQLRPPGLPLPSQPGLLAAARVRGARARRLRIPRPRPLRERPVHRAVLRAAGGGPPARRRARPGVIEIRWLWTPDIGRS